jgi:deoxyribodipyrimidine photolyase-related protein
MADTRDASEERRLGSLRVRGKVQRLAVVFGDQLDQQSSLLRSLSKENDAILLMEVAEEATQITSHKQRTLLFLAAMRHFALDLADRGYRVQYVTLDDKNNRQSFAAEIERNVNKLRPKQLVCMHPGDWRVLRIVEDVAAKLDVDLDIKEDEHFLVSRDDFHGWMQGRKTTLLEHFYRWQRREQRVLLTKDGDPIGGEWNYDKENRSAFKSQPDPPKPYAPQMDGLTRATAKLVEKSFPDAPGSLDDFRWPVTRTQALRALGKFIDERLPRFGDFQDAMWTEEPFLYHSLLSPALNLKLLNSRECIDKAVEAYEQGNAPINAVEGFVRQLLGWREFLRGVYWHEGEQYAERNSYKQNGKLPDCYWSGETDMACMRDCIGQVLRFGYGHHIQRLMVTGNFALIAGVEPRQVNDWYCGMYVDAVHWVTTPNVIGMVMHADGGVVGTKPYAASGKYIKRMSNHCADCRYDPGKRTGSDACPFSTFYWDFLLEHEKKLNENRRMNLILSNLDKLSRSDRREVRKQAESYRDEFGIS